MALIANNISGSASNSSRIGITGSVIFANRPGSFFPSLASDTIFFVSGSTDGTGRSVFGGDLMSSGSFNLKSGTGGASQFSVSTTGMLINTVAGTNTVQIAASTGNITTSGDIAVNGGDLTTTAATFNVTGATNYNIGTTASTGTIAVGISTNSNTVSVADAACTGTQTVNIGTGVTGAGISSIIIGSLQNSSKIDLFAGSSSGTGIRLVTGGRPITMSASSAGTIDIGTSSTSGDISIGGASTSTGLISVGKSTVDNTVAIANAACTGTQTVNMATGATGATGMADVTIGSTNFRSTVKVYAGSGAGTGLKLETNGGAVNVSASTDGLITIGTSATTGTTTIGGTSTTGTITIGQSTQDNEIDIGANSSISSLGTQTINIGTGNGKNVITIGSTGTNSGGSPSTLTLLARSDMLLSGSTSTTYTVGGETATGTITLGRSTSSNTINVGNANSTGTQTINVGAGTPTGAGKATITIGNITNDSSLTLRAGTGALVASAGTTGNILIGNAATSGVITLGSTSQTGTITIGQADATNIINIGNASMSAGTQQTVQIAGNAASSVVTIGTAAGTGSLTLRSGTGNIILSTGTAGTGGITVGNSTASNTISIGNANTGTGNTQTINIGAGTPAGTGKATIAIGNSGGAGSVTVAAGSGGLAFSTTGNAAISTANGTLQLTTGTGAINIGTDATSKSITIGSTTSATSATIRCGTGGISIGADALANILMGSSTTTNNGKVGIGITPSYKLDVATDAASSWVANFFNDGNATNRYGIRIQSGTDATTGDLIDFYDGDGTLQGTISFNAGTVTYGPFTGDHYARINDVHTEKTYGIIVKIVSTNSEPGRKNINYVVEKTTSAKDPAVFGVYAASLDASPDENLRDCHSIFSLGDGHILVTDEGGSIEIGDYICSSNIPGHGMKQDDDLLHSYTVAKATEAIDFSTVEVDLTKGYKSKLITCTYHAS